MHADSTVLNDLSGRVIGCAFTVLNTLGAGLLEKVYENALAIEMRSTPMGCNVPIISKRPVYDSACCSISANHVWKSDEW
jgi:hypothetical protein